MRPPGLRRAAALLASTVAIAVALAAPLPASAQRPARQEGRPLPWIGVRLGGMLAATSAAPGVPSAAGGGVYALLDGREFLADASVDAFGGSSATLFSGGLGIYLPFVPRNVTPYAGGGLRLGWSKFGGDGAFGLLPFLAGGVLFGREGYFQVRAELSWIFAAASEESAGRPGQSWHTSGPMFT